MRKSGSIHRSWASLMSVKPGTRLAEYEILAFIGAGGMGQAYRARDTKLGRDVAVKVLPEAFTRDNDRLARFEREARLLASLTLPTFASKLKRLLRSRWK